MIIHTILFLIGILLLYVGADRLVSGASKIASRFGIPSLVIGLTLVAFGTSAPELVVSLTAAVNNINDIALGNIIGSNIANIALILGIAASIKPLAIHIRYISSEIPIMIATAILLLILSINGLLGRIDGLLMFACLVVFFIYSYRAEKKEGLKQTEEEQKEFIVPDDRRRSTATLFLYIIVGLIGLTLGAQFLVNSSIELAKIFGVSEKVIGLTVVAIGTSLPELATSIVAAIKGETDISVANIVGSNIFNILGILGITAIINPVIIAGGLFGSGYILDYLLMILLSAGLWIAMRTGLKITRPEGVILLIIYVTYLCWLYFSG